MTKTTSAILAVTAALLAAVIGATVAYLVTTRQAVADVAAQVAAVEAQHQAEAALDAAEAAKAEIEDEIAALEAAATQGEADAAVISEPITTEWLDLHPYSDWRAVQRAGWEPEVEIRTVTNTTERITEPVVIIAPIFPDLGWDDEAATGDDQNRIWTDAECNAEYGWGWVSGYPSYGCIYHGDEGWAAEQEWLAEQEANATHTEDGCAPDHYLDDNGSCVLDAHANDPAPDVIACEAHEGPGSVPDGNGYCTTPST